MEEKEIVYEFAGFRLNPSERLLTRGDERIPLRPKTFALLVILVADAGRLLGKDELLREIWDDAVVEEGNLNRTVSELRKALGDPKDEPRLIETVPRVGYRFIAEVARIGEAPTELPAEPIPHTPEKIEVSVAASRNSSRVFFVGGIVAAIAVVSVLIGAWYLYGRAETKTEFGEKRLATGTDDANSPIWTSNSTIRFISATKDNRTLPFELDVDSAGAPRPASFLSPDGKYIIDTGEEKAGKIYISSADGSNKRLMPFVFGNMTWSRTTPEIVVQFFPGGKREASDIAIINIETLEWRNLTDSSTFDADPAFSPDSGQVAFVSNRDGNMEIYIMNRDGGDVRRLTNSPAWESFPAFSPDGTQLAYNSDRDHERNNVYIQDLDGSGRERGLPRGEWRNYTGSGFWSPDGTRIAYSSDRGEREELFFRDAELEKPREILADSGADLTMPYLTRDGKKLMYVAKMAKDKYEIRVQDRTSRKINVVRTLREPTRLSATTDGSTIIFHEKVDNNTEVCAVDADGGSFRTLTNSNGYDGTADISPDGSKIVFATNRRGRNVLELFVMNADGSDPRLVPNNNSIGTSISPIWTLDGRRIVFANDHDGGGNGNFELFMIDEAGGDAKRLFNNPRAADDEPTISPSDDRFVFQSWSRGNVEIYVTGMDQSILRVTRNLAEDREPIWNEDGTKIIFSSNRRGRFALYEVAP